MGKVLWIASYPKSGNTWMRAFLSSIQFNSHKDAEFLNKLVAPVASSRRIFEEQVCLESSEMTSQEIENLRPMAMCSYADEIHTNPFFIKAHDAYILTGLNKPLFPVEISLGSIYIVRNPLDVAVSFAHHNNFSFDTAIKEMTDENCTLARGGNTLESQLPQKLLSWSSHVKSWTQQAEMPVKVVRYEDMINDPLRTFAEVLRFAGLDFSEKEIVNAIEETSFEKLRSHEENQGYKGRTSKKAMFFRKGKIGSWRDELNEKQADQIIRDQYDMLKHLGYLDSQDNLVY